MSNISHYLKGIRSGNSFFTLKMKMNFIATFLGIFQAFLCAVYYAMGVMPLLIFSALISLFYFVVLGNMVKKEHFATAMVAAIFMVLVNSFVSTLYLGFSAGFNFYLFGAVAACFYLTFVIDSFQKRELIPALFSLFFMACYIFNYAMMKFVDPLYVLDNSGWYDALATINIIISFLIVITFNILFVWEIKARNDLLSSRNDQLDELAHKDPLTHLLNRRSMSEYLQKSVETLKINGKRFCLILCDIDNFKHVNDTYGHDAGDAVLVAVSDIISKTVRQTDVVCRWGGEEILILINDPIETASICAERIRKKLEEHTTVFGSQNINVTMTFGISESIPGYRIEQLIQQADDKLYIGKRDGKNRVVV